MVIQAIEGQLYRDHFPESVVATKKSPPKKPRG